MPVDTKTVKGRRIVHYESLRDVLADAEAMYAAGARPLGNWTPGQIFVHLARSFDASIDGSDLKLNWFFRLMGRLMKKKVLRGPMPPGFKLPEDAANKLVPAPTSAEDGLAELRRAVARQEQESSRAPSPFLGVLTNDEWTQLHLNHAALHMSFLAV
jgi:hypothetical protein